MSSNEYTERTLPIVVVALPILYSKHNTAQGSQQREPQALVAHRGAVWPSRLGQEFSTPTVQEALFSRCATCFGAK